jgi:intracellular sulfur oxidation DsrE/DsrF family protein
LFLNVDGVQVGSTKFPALSEQRTALGAFMKAGGAVVVCQHCMTVRNVQAADLMPGLAVGGEGGAMQAFLASTRSISY